MGGNVRVSRRGEAANDGRGDLIHRTVGEAANDALKLPPVASERLKYIAGRLSAQAGRGQMPDVPAPPCVLSSSAALQAALLAHRTTAAALDAAIASAVRAVDPLGCLIDRVHAAAEAATAAEDKAHASRSVRVVQGTSVRF